MQKEYYYKLKDEMMETLIKTLSIDTVRTAPADGAPFGKGVADCLAFVLDVAKKWVLKPTTATITPVT